jgi:hypothetical protein
MFKSPHQNTFTEIEVDPEEFVVQGSISFLGEMWRKHKF